MQQQVSCSLLALGCIGLELVLEASSCGRVVTELGCNHRTLVPCLMGVVDIVRLEVLPVRS